MDFEAAYQKEHGHGRYERLSAEVFEFARSLPFFLAYEADPSDSGKIHANVRTRWEQKDPEVIEAMAHFADLTCKAREALERKDHAALADLMDDNFNTRRRVYGDPCLGRKNLQMIDICRRHGAAAKFPGSGGAVLGLCRPGANEAAKFEELREALEAENFVFCPLDPVMPQ
eukprot:gnl/TRDRNA2_/TRDRNA2_91322_c0_seq1.p1 gnl/TRDRNA2_/TRDRNA2_91322_c0~~gnl/TRDRNA2_/TRDRNA2_91322_c0_seq1.p1  ORF type:complete len:184 (-),score=42.65 gnl/TRDRNA2_/TRDRNA2_91322_c0_seq1:91-606(-)